MKLKRNNQIPLTQNPTSLLRNGVSKSPYHAFPPSKGDGELSSEGIITKWGRMSTSKKGKLLRG